MAVQAFPINSVSAILFLQDYKQTKDALPQKCALILSFQNHIIHLLFMTWKLVTLTFENSRNDFSTGYFQPKIPHLIT